MAGELVRTTSQRVALGAVIGVAVIVAAVVVMQMLSVLHDMDDRLAGMQHALNDTTTAVGATNGSLGQLGQLQRLQISIDDQKTLITDLDHKLGILP